MKKLEDIKDENYLHIYIGRDLKNRLVKIAKSKGLSLNALMRMIATTYANEEEDKR